MPGNLTWFCVGNAMWVEWTPISSLDGGLQPTEVKNFCNLLLYQTTKHDFEHFWGGNCPAHPWLRPAWMYNTKKSYCDFYSCYVFWMQAYWKITRVMQTLNRLYENVCSNFLVALLVCVMQLATKIHQRSAYSIPHFPQVEFFSWVPPDFKITSLTKQLAVIIITTDQTILSSA